MKVIQSYSTYPAPGKEINNLDLIFLVISAALARNYAKTKVNLYCNRALKEKIAALGVTKFWDTIDICEIERFMSENKFDPHLYFTASKCHILASISPPWLYVDHDFFLLENPQFLEEDFDLAFAHLESIADFKRSFPSKDEYYFPPDYPTNEVAIADEDIMNTSIIAIKNSDFQQCYRKLLEGFFKNNLPDTGKVYRTAQFNLPDQRFFTAAAKNFSALNILGKKFVKAKDGAVKSELTDKCHLTHYRHIWSMKELLKKSKTLRKKFLNQMINDLAEFVSEDITYEIKNTRIWLDLISED